MELYKKTLAGFKACLSKGDSITLSKYCKKNEWVSWRGLRLKGKYKLRDIWRQKDLGEFDGSFGTEIRYHGVVMIRMDKI